MIPSGFLERSSAGTFGYMAERFSGDSFFSPVSGMRPSPMLISEKGFPFLCFYILTEREMDQIQCELDEYQKYKFSLCTLWNGCPLLPYGILSLCTLWNGYPMWSLWNSFPHVLMVRIVKNEDFDSWVYRFKRHLNHVNTNLWRIIEQGFYPHDPSNFTPSR